MTTDSLWTVDDLAKRLKVSERTVYRMLKTGRLRGAKVGRTWRFRDQDVLDMFKRASVVAKASLLQRSPVVSKMPRCPFRSCATMPHPATSTVTVRLFEADAKAVGISSPQPLFRCLRCESVWREPITNIIEPVGTLRGQDFTPFTFVGSAELWRGTIYSSD